MGRLLREEDVQKTIYNLLTDGTIKPTSAMENYGFENTARLVVSNIPSAFDVEAVVKELEELKGQAFLTLANTDHAVFDFAYNQVLAYLEKAIEIVRKGGVK